MTPSARLPPSLLAALLLGVVLLTANYKLTLATVVPKWDADRYYAPSLLLIADHARAGTFLLWDPWTNAGTPAYADPEMPSFSPLAMVIGAITGATELSFRVYWLTIWLLGGLGVLLLGTHLGAPLWASWVIALGYMFSGLYTGHAEHTSILYTISSLAFLIWRLDAALSRQTFRPAVEAGVIWGLSGLGGYPAWVFLNACFAALWAVGRVFFCTRIERPPIVGTIQETAAARPSMRFAFVAVAILVVAGVVVLSPTYAAFLLEAPGYTDRSQPIAREVAVTSNALHPGAVATFANPYLAILKQYNPALWSETDISTISIYLGPIIPVLALLSLMAGRRNYWRWWIAGIGMFFLLASIGDAAPLRGWTYDLVSPTRYFRHAGMVRIYPMFVLVVLALLATRDLFTANVVERRKLAKRLAAAAVVISVLAIVAYYRVMLTVGNAGDYRARAELQLWLGWSIVVAAAITFAWRTGAAMKPMRALLIALAILDGLLTIRISQSTMWYEHPRLTESWTRLEREHSSALDLTSRGLQREHLAPRWSTVDAEPHNKNVALKIATVENYSSLNNRFHLDLVQRPILREMATGTIRIWCASQVAEVPASEAAYVDFAARAESLGSGVLVVHSRGRLMADAGSAADDSASSIRELPPMTAAAVKLHTYRPNVLTFEAFCPDKGWLLVTDRWARGWRATVNGKPVDVWGGNFIFRAVPVDAGTNHIEFTYEPIGFPVLLILSWSVTFGSLVLSLKER